jgi:bifunctional DNA-binding transcriptional regulator/antitoxin component of YhaV-PrlF toxin-antitoxin module
MTYINNLERKTISVTGKRQITIPLKFFQKLNIGQEVECILHGDELIIKPLERENCGEFDEYILRDLVHEGYVGEALVDEFKVRRKKIRPAVEKMIDEADKTAKGKKKAYTYDEVFGDNDDQ